MPPGSALAGPRGAGATSRGSVTPAPAPRRHTVPAFGRSCVSRPELVHRLAANRQAWLALLTAPAGYGKTTLLAEWAAVDSRPFVWVTLDERDGERERLADGIAEALRHSGVEEHVLEAMLTALHGSRTPAAPRAPGRRARSARAGLVLVLDDAHVVEPHVLAETVAVLHRHLPADAQIALAARATPALPLARLRASRAVVEVRPEDLAMTAGEAAGLLQAAGLHLDAAAVQQLVVRTDGWPAALYLATLSLRAQGDPPGAAERFSGADRLVAEYVRDELLGQLAPDEREFLRCASVLDEVSGPACDGVLARHGSGTLIPGLVDRGLLVPLQPSHERCRWPGLLRETLAAELRRTQPDRALQLHARASDWYAEQGDIDRAIEQAVRAGDIARTGDLLWPHALGHAAGGANDAVRAWLGAFGDEQLAHSATLSATAATSHLLGGEAALAAHWARIAAGALRRAPEVPPAPSLRTGLILIEAATARGGATAMGSEAMRAYELEPDDSPWRGVCCLLAGSADYLLGDRDRARARLREGEQRSEIAAPLIAALSLAMGAMIAIECEDWDGAGEASTRAARTIEAHRLGDEPASALTFAVAAAVQAHHGRVDEAKRSLGHATELIVALGDFIPWYDASARILLARAALGLADVARAGTLLAEASRMARRAADATIFPEWLDDAWRRVDERAEAALPGPLGASALTTAELRILRFLPTHLSLREIAKRLHVSANTVKTQAHAVYRKLDASSRSEAVARATEAGLLGESGPLARP